LAVLDTITRQVTDYCIPTYPGIYFGAGAYVPPRLWSPDSKQLIIENINTNQTTSRVILVDVVHGIAAQIAENMTPGGWMKAP